MVDQILRQAQLEYVGLTQIGEATLFFHTLDPDPNGNLVETLWVQNFALYQ